MFAVVVPSVLAAWLLPPAPVTLVLGAALLTGLLAAAMLTMFLVETVFLNGPVSIESRWSGLGGGLGGWTISRAMIYLVSALFFGGVTAVIVVQHLQSEQAKANQQFELLKAREADERKYQDAERARVQDLEKARLGVPAQKK